ncbi:Archaeal Lon protease [Candidatus Gugararchaeum adminiculabundum]|nr:Archaeal Lon protease [Candidatus Gugararchaeum adminiculabundum]
MFFSARNLFLAVVFLALLSATAFADCTAGKSALYAPAVGSTNDGAEVGVLLIIEAETRAGTGTIFVSTEPLVGFNTQASEKKAVAAAAEIAGANKNDCDYFFKIIDPSGTYQVDGPSAGAALTVLTLSNLEGKTIRRDFSITGTIEDNGIVGEIGGVVPKARAAAARGVKVFAVPSQPVYEKMRLISVAEEQNMSIIEVSKISDVAAIAFSQEGSKLDSKITIALSPRPNVTDFIADNSVDMQAFAAITGRLLADFNTTVKQLESNDPARKQFHDYFANELGNAQIELGKNYYYTSANTAFTALIDAKLLLAINSSKDDLQDFVNETERCVNSLDFPEKGTGNFEYIAGAQVRKEWASKKIGEVKDRISSKTEDIISDYRELLYARAWCDVSRELSQSNIPQGAPIDESTLESYARGKLQQAKAKIDQGGSPDASDDLTWHYESANALYQQGDYIASVIDSSYVISSVDSLKELSANSDSLSADIDLVPKKRYSSFWARAYGGQAAFIYNEGNASGSLGTRVASYGLSRFSDALETSAKDIKSELANNSLGLKGGDSNSKPGAGSAIQGGQGSGLLVGILLTGIMLAAVFVMLFLQKLNENKK